MNDKNDQKRLFCSRIDCIIKTCSRHRCHISKFYKKIHDWKDFSDTCGMCISGTGWLFQPPKRDEVLDDSD